MKIAAITATALAVVTAGAVATPSFAQPYGYYGQDEACQARQHDNGTTGAVLGGIAGALIGSNLASHHGGRTGGAALGAVAGALIGNNIGRSTAKNSDLCEDRDYGRVAYRGQPSYAGGDYQRGGYYHGRYDRGGERPYRYSGYDPYSY